MNENIQLYSQCVLHPRLRNSNLNRITLPALAYGASLSGITVGSMIGTKVPSPRAWEPIMPPLQEEMGCKRARTTPPPYDRV
jgi:hypothetical protein